MNRDSALLLAHALAVAGAAFALTVLIPYPHLWAHLPGSAEAFAFAMNRSGPLHIVLGAAAMLGYGASSIGWRRTLIFFAIASALSLGMELLGTGTGWPFGAYAYTEGLGTKVLGRVPWSIPLSWFYVGFASFLLARAVLARWRPDPPAWSVVALGTWLLVAWDLVLDPAMAHPDLPIRFWIWHQRGAYLGMPLVNLAGWVMCGALFMGLSRWAWGSDVNLEAIDRRGVYAVYAVNVLFGMVLCASLGLWGAIVLGAVAGLVPAALALRAPKVPATVVLKEG